MALVNYFLSIKLHFDHSFLPSFEVAPVQLVREDSLVLLMYIMLYTLQSLYSEKNTKIGQTI